MYSIFKNYGLTIIILTILIKLILMPLTYKSMVSQKKLALLQPKIKDIQDRFKDNPEALNKEMMGLYKREKINPLSGCLPILLQMPILIAMYNILNKMVGLKGAEFLWITDLSQPDSVWPFPNGFTIPFFNITSLNILPFLMVGVQMASTLLMPQTGQTNKQAAMMIWVLPIVFFLLFYNISSGLVLYWTVMNILNLLQQIVQNYFDHKKQVALK
jgi:YidC/Oxa1 family membrane protein insertase